jgi:chromosome segregation ATPase
MSEYVDENEKSETAQWYIAKYGRELYLNQVKIQREQRERARAQKEAEEQERKRELEERIKSLESRDCAYLEGVIQEAEQRLENANQLVATIDQMYEEEEKRIEETATEIGTYAVKQLKQKLEREYADKVAEVQRKAQEELKATIRVLRILQESAKPLLSELMDVIALMNQRPLENTIWRLTLYRTEKDITTIMENMTGEEAKNEADRITKIVHYINEKDDGE